MNSRGKLFVGVTALTLLFLALIFRHELIWQSNLLMAPSAPGLIAPPPAPHCPNCNVILISLDTLRADRMGFLGSSRGLTPNLDKIAARSFVFENAFTNAFFTTPSHMTVFTSLYPTTHRVEGTDVKVPRLPKTDGPAIALGDRYQTLAEMLRDSGFDTAWAAPLNFRFLDFHDGFGRGFKHVGPPVFMRGLHFPLKRPMNLESAQLEKTFTPLHAPYFLFLHSYVTHLPYVPASGGPDETEVPYHPEFLLEALPTIAERNADSLFPGSAQKNFDPEKALETCTRFEAMDECFKRYISPDQLIHRLGQWQLRLARKAIREHGTKGMNERELTAFISAYDEVVQESDRQIGQLWEDFARRGILKNSIIVIFSDHGEELFEHGEGNHSTFYEHTARVPLLIYVPNSSPVVSSQLVSLIDVVPSIFGILEKPAPTQIQGRSLFDAKADRSRVFGSSLGVTYVRDREWKLIQSEQGSPELYNLRVDPLERENLIKLRLPSVQTKLSELEAALADFRLGQAL